MTNQDWKILKIGGWIEESWRSGGGLKPLRRLWMLVDEGWMDFDIFRKSFFLVWIEECWRMLKLTWKVDWDAALWTFGNRLFTKRSRGQLQWTSTTPETLNILGYHCQMRWDWLSHPDSELDEVGSRLRLVDWQSRIGNLEARTRESGR